MLAAYVFFPDDRRRRPTVIVLATLFILPYLAAGTSSESMSANLFSLGLATIVLGSAWRRGVETASLHANGNGDTTDCVSCLSPLAPRPSENTPHPQPLSRKGRGETLRLSRKGRGETLRLSRKGRGETLRLSRKGRGENSWLPRPSSLAPRPSERCVVPWTTALVAGVFFGLAFECRYQIAFAVLGVMAWIFCFSAEHRWPRVRKLVMLSCGVIAMVGVGTAVDCWGYGQFVVAPWNYFQTNILLHAADRFGVTPVWWYFIGVNSGPMIVLTVIWTVAMLAMWIRYPKHILTWATLAFCLAHCLVAHKEVRFLFPIVQVGAMAIVLGIGPRPGGMRYGASRLLALLAHLWRRRHSRWAMVLYAANFVALAVMGFTTRQQSVLLQKMIYERYPRNCYAYILGKDTKSLYQNVGVDMYFYRPAEFHLNRLDGYDELNSLVQRGPGKFLLITDCVHKAPEQDLVAPRATLVYRSYPEWVEKYNYFNWLERSRCYSVYEVERDEKDSDSRTANRLAANRIRNR